jgi:hypothetical protein
MTISVALDERSAAAIATVAGIPPAATAYTVQRESPSGSTVGVRGAVRAPVAGDTAIVHDYEAPLDVELVYTAIAYDTGGELERADAAPFLIPWDKCESWLVDLARPTNSLVLTLESFTALTFDFAAGVHRVLNRRAPVLTTLPAYTPSGELVVLTDTLDERDQMRAMLGNGYPILVRAPDLGIGNMYLGLTQFIEERFLTLGARPERRFRIAATQVERPDPAYYVPRPPNTYQNVADTYATYADLAAAVGTYDELAYSWPDAPQPSPIEPWLPDDI